MGLQLHVQFQYEELGDEAPEGGIAGPNLAMEHLSEHYEPKDCHFQSLIVHTDHWDNETFHDPEVVSTELAKARKIAPEIDESHFWREKDYYVEQLEILEWIVDWAVEKEAKIALVLC